MTPRRPLFVVGPPRSGTTLLRVMLCRHPDCWVLTETHLLDLWVPRHPGLAEGDPAAFEDYWAAFTATEPFTWLGVDADAVAARVRRTPCRAVDVMAAMLVETAHARGVGVVGEKTPDHAHHVGVLLDAFPDARVLWLQRDPVATVASELALDARWASDDVEVAAHRWATTSRAWLPWATDPRVLAVRFEELVADPDTALRRVCHHVGLPWDPAMLVDEGGHDRYRHGQRDPWAAVDGSAADRPELTTRELEVVDAVAGPTARAIGYLPPRRHARGRLVLAGLRAARHARRLATTISRSSDA